MVVLLSVTSIWTLNNLSTRWLCRIAQLHGTPVPWSQSLGLTKGEWYINSCTVSDPLTANLSMSSQVDMVVHPSCPSFDEIRAKTLEDLGQRPCLWHVCVCDALLRVQDVISHQQQCQQV